MTPRLTTSKGAHKAIHPPAIPVAEDLYDQIMGKIEPDLTTKHLPTLKTKYAKETAEHAKARAERYAKAFEEYEKQLAAHLADLDAKVHTFQRASLASLEQKEHQKEETEVSNLLHQMTDA